jgi:hypothetical protein
MRQDEDLNDPHGLNGLANYLNEFKKELFKLKSYLVKTNKENENYSNLESKKKEINLQKTLV